LHTHLSSVLKETVTDNWLDPPMRVA